MESPMGTKTEVERRDRVWNSVLAPFLMSDQLNKFYRSGINALLSGEKILNSTELSPRLFEPMCHHYLVTQLGKSDLLLPDQSCKYMMAVHYPESSIFSRSFGADSLRDGYCPDGIVLNEDGSYSIFEYTLHEDHRYFDNKLGLFQYFMWQTGISADLTFVVPQHTTFPESVSSNRHVCAAIEVPLQRADVTRFSWWLYGKFRQYPDSATLAEIERESDIQIIRRVKRIASGINCLYDDRLESLDPTELSPEQFFIRYGISSNDIPESASFS